MKIHSTIKKEALEMIKNSIKVPFREIKISGKIAFLFFQIGEDPYYIKVLS